MQTGEIQKFLHELNNALNSANINASLLHRMHDGTMDKDTMRRLESALRDAEKLSKEFQQRVSSEVPSVRDLVVRQQGVAS